MEPLRAILCTCDGEFEGVGLAKIAGWRSMWGNARYGMLGRCWSLKPRLVTSRLPDVGRGSYGRGLYWCEDYGAVPEYSVGVIRPAGCRLDTVIKTRTHGLCQVPFDLTCQHKPRNSTALTPLPSARL